ncbi:MAG: hypothetical protein ACXWNI_00900 [Candidatus Limnocylindrales bacterium]
MRARSMRLVLGVLVAMMLAGATISSVSSKAQLPLLSPRPFR